MMSTKEFESIFEQLAERLKRLERALNRIEGQVADLYSRVKH